MKYLIQNRKEFVITLGILATIILVIVWSLWSLIHGEFDFKNLIAVAAAIFEILGWYYNMPTSEENCEATGEMRIRKAEKTGKLNGEYFYGDDGMDDEDFQEVEEDDSLK